LNGKRASRSASTGGFVFHSKFKIQNSAIGGQGSEAKDCNRENREISRNRNNWEKSTDEFLVCPTVFFAAKMRKMRKQVKFSGPLSSVFKSSV
jgi:hypothetical protein